jgi:hypothetical protein
VIVGIEVELMVSLRWLMLGGVGCNGISAAVGGGSERVLQLVDGDDVGRASAVTRAASG